MHLVETGEVRFWPVPLLTACLGALLALLMAAPATGAPPRALSDGIWAPNVKVNDDTGIARQHDPAIAVDARSNTYAVWQDNRNGNYDIYFSYRPAGGSWGANVRVNDDAGTATQGYPSIAVDGGGNGYAVWEDCRSRDCDIYFSHRPAGGSWGANVRVNDDAGTAWQGYPSIAVDGGGNAYAVWQDWRGGKSDIYFSYRAASGAWGANVRVDDDVGMDQDYLPCIAVDASGNAYVVWEDFRGGVSGDIYFSHRPAGGSWGANVRVDDDAGTALQGYPSIAVDGGGNGYAVWQDHRNGRRDIYFSYRPAEGSSGANVRVNDDAGPAWQAHPSITVDGGGNAYAVWKERRNGDSDIYSSYRPVGGSWSASTRLNDDVGFADQMRPSLAMDPMGNAYAVWQDGRNGNNDIYFSYHSVGGSWGANIRVDDDAGTSEQENPSITVGLSGNAYAVWEDSRNGDPDIYFSYWPVYPFDLEEEFVPELGTLALLVSGLAGLAGYASLPWRK